jgi:hypothetical protein
MLYLRRCSQDGNTTVFETVLAFQTGFCLRLVMSVHAVAPAVASMVGTVYTPDTAVSGTSGYGAEYHTDAVIVFEAIPPPGCKGIRYAALASCSRHESWLAHSLALHAIRKG